jgi:hypothetical protein
MSSIPEELTKLSKEELIDIFQKNGIWYDGNWDKKKMVMELTAKDLTKDINFPKSVEEWYKGEEIEVPKPNFNPEELYVNIDLKESNKDVSVKCIPYYGVSVSDGKQMDDDATRSAVKIYTEWLLNHFFELEEVESTDYLNASMNYLVSVDVIFSKETRKSIHKFENNIKKKHDGVYIYPDIYRQGYLGTLGFPVTREYQYKKPNRKIMDVDRMSRQEYLDKMKQHGELLGHSGMSDSYEGYKFKYNKSILYVGKIGAISDYFVDRPDSSVTS